MSLITTDQLRTREREGAEEGEEDEEDNASAGKSLQDYLFLPLSKIILERGLISADMPALIQRAADDWQPPSTDALAQSHSCSFSHLSAIPASVLADQAVECVLGVDEAGRGPVLGPMVYGVAYCPITYTDEMISEHGFMDSKVLDHNTRVSLFQRICSKDDELYRAIGWAVRVMSARDISAGMLKPIAPYNLNAQAHDTTIQLIKDVLATGVNIRKIFVDTVGIPEIYQAKLAREFPMAEVIVAKKADSLYPIVSVASICAKVTRDKSLEMAAAEVGATASSAGDEGDCLEKAEFPSDIASTLLSQDVDLSNEQQSKKQRSEASLATLPGETGRAEWGSGYPSDARTVTWLKANKNPIFGWPVKGGGVRYSWSTVKDLLEPPSSTSSSRTRNSKRTNTHAEDIFVMWHDETEEEAGQPMLSFEPKSPGFNVNRWYGTNVGAQGFS